jgi:type IX secretion system PorP/SprF family membrane protein
MKTIVIFLRHRLRAVMILLLLLEGTISFAQQKPMFSQYMFNMMNINPAYAGSRESLNISALYRNQWVGIEGAPKTVSLSFDQRKVNSNVGFGFQFYDDRIGIEKSSGVQGFYSYRVPFNNSTLTLGMNGGLLNYTANYLRVSTIQSGDPAFMTNVSGWLPTFGAGALYSTKNWYAGISVPDLLKTKITEQGRADVTSSGPFLHLFATAGFIKPLNDQITFKPSFLLKAVSGAPIQLDLNVNAWFNNTFSVGASYRTGDAIVGLLELQATPQIRIGYGYDHTISKLSSYSRGSHELMLRFEFASKGADDVVSPRYY